MAAPIGLATTNTTGASFVFNNIQAVEYGSNSNNSNSVVAIPNVQALGKLAAQQMTGRLPGGAAYLQPSNTVLTAPANTNAALILIDGQETYASSLPYKKNGSFIVSLAGTTNSTVPMTNTQTNTNSFAGDTAFNTIYQMTVYNMSGLDGNPAAALNVVTGNVNGLSFGSVSGTNGVFNGITVDASSRITIESVNGWVVNAANKALIFTPTGTGTVGVVVCGA